MTIKNIIFDIGNVLIEWKPIDIIINFFPNETKPELLAKKIFKSPTWFDLNLGKITELEAIKLYHKQLNISIDELEKLMMQMKYSLLPINSSIQLLDELYSMDLVLFSITDNVKEIMSFLKAKYCFFKKFTDIIVSAELGVLKPDKRIYLHLIEKYNLRVEETIFIDDIMANVQGAKQIGMYGIHFTNTIDCRNQLKNFGLNI